MDKKAILEQIKNAPDLKALDDIYREYLGKNGEIFLMLKNLRNLPKDQRAETGRRANEMKDFIGAEIKKKSNELKILGRKKELEKETIDVTAPGKKMLRGHLHPLTLVLRQVQEIFGSIGFEIVDGPEVETEWYNFDALNIPKDHPARDMWDTFWLKQTTDYGKQTTANMADSIQTTANSTDANAVSGSLSAVDHLLLRTHTSPVQVRYMETHQPPFRIIAPGRCFRHEATDASHDVQFHQVEGLMVGRDISLANMKGVMELFMERFFGEKVELRWQPGYFPFVEPGLELLIKRESDNKWLEIAGAGMVHPNVFKAVKYNPKDWQGFAFGMGLDRIAMMKYKIDDIRLFYGGDLRFLKQF